MHDHATAFLDLIGRQPLIPVIRIERASDAVPLARALARGGLPAIEITLRTDAALEAIRAARAEVPEAIVGAGTVLDPTQFDAVVAAGASFIVSPGITSRLLERARHSDTPFLPGAVTPGEMMVLMDAGYRLAKFFPAEQSGGAALLKSVASPLAGLRFCPTGGISPANARSYLDLPNVACIGGSWVAPDDLIRDGRWEEITRLAGEASKLRG